MAKSIPRRQPVLAEGTEAEADTTDRTRQVLLQVCWSNTTLDHLCVGAVCAKIIRCLSGFRKISKCPFLWMISIHPVMSVETLQEYFEVAGGYLHWSANVSRYDLNRVCSAERLTFLHSRAFGTVLFPVAPIKSRVEQAKAARSLCGSSIAGGSFHST